jgi:hypothetical protein
MTITARFAYAARLVPAHMLSESGLLPFLLALAANSFDAFGAFKHAFAVLRVTRLSAHCRGLRHSHNRIFATENAFIAILDRHFVDLCARHGGISIFLAC